MISKSRAATVVAVALCLAPPVFAHQRAPAQQPSVKPAQAAPPAWAAQARRALEAGRAEEARTRAEQELARDPASVDAAALKIDAEAALALPAAALDTYDGWQRAARREDPALLARVARAHLWRAVRTTGELAAADAAAALTAAGDRDARAALTKMAAEGVGTTTGLAALRALATLGDASASSALVAAVTSGAGNARASALAALSKADARVATSAVLKAIEEPSLFVRLSAISTAGRLGITEATPLLVRLLGERPFIVGLSAASALRAVGDARGDAVLQQALDSELPDVRLTAATALAQRGPGQWVAAVQPLLANRDGLFRLQAAELLLPIDRAAAFRTLTEATTSDNVVVRNETARILSADPTTSVAELRRLLRDGSLAVQVHVASRLLRDATSTKKRAPEVRPGRVGA